MEMSQELQNLLQLVMRLGVKASVTLKSGSTVPWTQLLRMTEAQLRDIPKQSPDSLVTASRSQLEQDITDLINLLLTLHKIKAQTAEARTILLQEQQVLANAIEERKNQALKNLSLSDMEARLEQISRMLAN